MFHNWGENVVFEPKNIYSPKTVEEIIEHVKQAVTAQTKIRVVGAAHSFSPLVETQETLINLEHLQGLISVDKANKRASLWAGTNIWALGPMLEPHGLSLPNQGDIDRQSIAGAMSTGTHGTGLQFASLAGFIHEVEFVDGTGTLRTINESTPGDLINAVRVAMGTFGIFTKLTLNLTDLFFLEDNRCLVTLEQCLNTVEKDIHENRHYEFFWFPYSKYAQIKRCNAVQNLSPRNPVLRFLSDEVLERIFFGILCEFTKIFTKFSAVASRISGRLMPSTVYSNLSFKVYPSSRHVKFTEMEYAVPLESGIACFKEVQSFIETEKIQVFFPVEYRVAGPDTAWISSMYGRKSAIISLHVYAQIDQDRYFSGVEKIFKKYNGRPHWGKIHNLSKSELNQMHPNWQKFCDLRKTYDPQGVFLNKMLSRYFEG